MIGNVDISKTLKMMHEAARYSFNSNNPHKAIDILNDARIIEQKMGFKNQAAESMLEIADAYMQLKNYDLAMWFSAEAMVIVSKTNKTSILNKAQTLVENILEVTACEAVAT